MAELKRFDQSVDFDNPGVVNYFLVVGINGREIRFPVPKDTVDAVIGELYAEHGDAAPQPPPRQARPPEPPPPVPPSQKPFYPPGVRHAVAPQDADLYDGKDPDEEDDGRGLGFPPPPPRGKLGQMYGAPQSESDVEPL